MSTDGVGQPCPALGCAEGQVCVTQNSSEGELSTCEIPCAADTDCPQGWRCNLPPITPGSVPDVCVTE